MTTKGHVTCKISLGPLQVLQDIVVADLQEDAILGMGFLLSHDCKLDLVEQKNANPRYFSDFVEYPRHRVIL